MKQIHSDIRHGIVKLKPETMDDLYVLSNLIEKGDIVKARTIRKIKIGSEEDRKKSIIKKPVTLSIMVEKAEFSVHSPILKVSGRIAEEHEDIPKGSFHSLSIEENSVITLLKEKWMAYQLEKLRESFNAKYPGILMVILDREEAFYVLVEKYGYKILSDISGDVQKKRYETKHSDNFFRKIVASINEYAERYKDASLVIASPAFWKEDLFEMLDEKIKARTILATCSSADTTAIEELLKRPELKTALKNARIHLELNIVDKFLTEIAKNNLATYGLSETKYCASTGAVDTLLVTDGLIANSREKNTYPEIESIMKDVESMNGRIVIISSDNHAGKSLDALTGIGALLRYKTQY